jgi:hypothetical protein
MTEHSCTMDDGCRLHVDVDGADDAPTDEFTAIASSHCRDQRAEVTVKKIMVRYKVKPECAADNEALVGAVFEDLHRIEPTGFSYATFQLEDGVTFVHVVVENGEAGTPLADVPAFQRFLEGVAQRCEEPPVATEMREIGSYHFFAA